MPDFTLTRKARADLIDTARFTQSPWGRDQRLNYLAMLDACFHRLAAEPLTGKACSEIRSGYLRYYAGRHVIFYRQRDSRTEIIRILHGGMDIETRLAEP